MTKTTTRARARTIAMLTVALGMTAAACGSDDDTATTVAPADTATAPTATTMTDDMDMAMDMNMGDPDATRADDIAGAALARGPFELLETRPQGYDDVTGSAALARHSAGTTVTLELSGLPPNVDFISHVHAESCAPNNGGPHYQFEIGGSTMPPNEVHLAFTSDADGNGFMTAENHDIVGIDAVALVVHPAEFLDNKVACVDFVEDEPGAAAVAIAAGTQHATDEMDTDTDQSTTTLFPDPMDG